MTWVRSDDNEPNHPKIFRAGVAGYGFFQAAKCYCSRNLTDGFIPIGDISLILPSVTFAASVKLCIRLVECGLFEKEETGYRVHDYLHYNPSKEQVQERRAERAESGRSGGVAKAIARAKAGARPELRTPACPVPSRPVPDPERSVGSNGHGHAADADVAFLAALKGNAAYRGIDVDREAGKLKAWLLTPRGRGKKFTRQRFVNWLNRADRELTMPDGDDDE